MAWQWTDVEDHRITDRIDHLRDAGAQTRVPFEALIGPVDDPTDIDWAVVGRESRSESVCREMDHAWAQAILERCRAQEAAHFYKQSSGRHHGQNRELQLSDGSAGWTEEIPSIPPVTVAPHWGEQS